MRRIEFEELILKRQYRPDMQAWSFDRYPAYDTETIQGRTFLICNSDGDYIHPKNFEQCIKFLTRWKNRDTIGWFYNLNFDIESILKFLHEDVIREFKVNGELKELIISKTLTVSITLIDRKFFKIVRNKNAYMFFDIMNFYKGGLDTNAKKYLNKRKLKIPVDFEKDSDAILEKFFKSKRGINYCIRDAVITSGLAKLFVDTCNNFGIWAKNFSSPASLATHYFSSNVKIPTLNEITGGRALRSRFGYEAYKGGFIQCFKKGYFENIYLYDINSAYPYMLTKLPDMKKGRLIASPKGILKNAHMGWMRVLISSKNRNPYGPDYYNPIATYLKPLNKNFYLAGRIRATITLLEYEALKNDFNIEVKEGIYWIPEDDIYYMYKNSVEKLYNLRLKNKDDKNLNLVLKTILNGFYGKLIQKIPRPVKNGPYVEFTTGNFFNPFHGSYVTAGTRLMIYETLKKYGPQNAVAVMTDAIAFTKKMNLPISTKLGGWSLDFKGEGVFIGSGLYSLASENRVKIKTATRGFKLTDKLNFFSLLAKYPDDTEIKLEQNIRLSMREALRVHKFLNWNVINKTIKKININCDNKRAWNRNFKNCLDVLENTIDSSPIYVKM